MSTNPNSSGRATQQALGARLREIRSEAGLTGRAIAAATGQHFTRVSKIENGVQQPTIDDIRLWCRACDAEDQLPDLLATLRALESSYDEHRRAARAGMKRVTGVHTADLYEQTTYYRIYEHNVIPGLFQTADYCAAMISFWTGFLDAPNSPEDLAAAVGARMERQRVLFQHGKRFSVILEEQALRTWFGDAAVQARQLSHLLTLMSLPSVALGVIPMMVQRGAVPSAGFWIFDAVRVALEIPTASIEVTRPSEVELYERMFEDLHRVALYGKPARAVVMRVAAELT